MTVFLSYARGDEGVVATMARAFEAARREIWYDDDLQGGDIWWPTILDRIRSCRVFLFALSDNSLESRACLEELDYAEKLGRPVLLVRVGPVVKQQTSPLAQVQFVQFVTDDAVSAFEVLAAADRSAERCPPLPDPLPPEPPVPFAYLSVIRRLIEETELDAGGQLDVIDQLRRALGEEADASVRQEIVAMLKMLRDQPWCSGQAELEIGAVLAASEVIEREIARTGRDAIGEPDRTRPPPGQELTDSGIANIAAPHVVGSRSGPLRILLSYRRDDTLHVVGRLFDRLADRFGERNVFMDLGTAQPGLDLGEVVEHAVAGCHVLVVLIGKRWAAGDDGFGRRLGNPDDVVTLEIRAALDRNIRIAQVLVDGAAAPDRGDLPESLAPLARRTTTRINHDTFRTDIGPLVRMLDQVHHS